MYLNYTFYLKKLYIIACAAVLVTGSTSCSKDEVTEEPGKEEPGTTTGVATGIYNVVNVVTDPNANGATNAQTFYYSLEDNKVVPESQRSTTNWDIALWGIYNSSISPNNGNNRNSLGYGGPGKGGIYMVMNSNIDAQYYDNTKKMLKSVPARALFDQAFDAVTTVPATEDQLNLTGNVNLDHFTVAEDGWAWYDFYGDLFPNAPGNTKQHVAYAMPRPIIIKTAKGHYAKVIIYSLYKDAPVDPSRANQVGYVSFKYAIQKDGSKNLNIK